MTDKERILKDFLLENFDFNELKRVGFYNNEIKQDDNQKQAERICSYFGLENIYQYGFENINAHISYADGKRPKDEPFISEFKAWHED
jgi:hypothetical protein